VIGSNAYKIKILKANFQVFGAILYGTRLTRVKSGKKIAMYLRIFQKEKEKRERVLRKKDENIFYKCIKKRINRNK